MSVLAPETGQPSISHVIVSFSVRGANRLRDSFPFAQLRGRLRRQNNRRRATILISSSLLPRSPSRASASSVWAFCCSIRCNSRCTNRRLHFALSGAREFPASIRPCRKGLSTASTIPALCAAAIRTRGVRFVVPGVISRSHQQSPPNAKGISRQLSATLEGTADLLRAQRDSVWVSS